MLHVLAAATSPSSGTQVFLYFVAIVLLVIAAVIAWLAAPRSLINHAIALIAVGIAVSLIVPLWVAGAAK